MFALFEDDFPSFMRPQASLPSAAQPAVMDIRPLRGRLLEILSIVNAKVFIKYCLYCLKKTSQAKSFKNIVFKNHASGCASPFHMVCLFLFTRKSSQKCFIVIVPRPRYMCTPTEIHAYPDRNTCVPRPKYMRTPTEVHAYLGRGTITF